MRLQLEETYQPGVYTDDAGNRLSLAPGTRDKLEHTGGLVATVDIAPHPTRERPEDEAA